MEVDSSLKDNFQLIKSVGIALSLATIVLFQLMFPNRLALRELLPNWRVNFSMAVINSLLFALLCGACVCTWAVLIREHEIGFFALAQFPHWLEIGLTVVILDAVAWAWHRANHHWPFLWRFHSVHHSDQLFDASTAFRFHPGELLISLGIRLLVVTLTALPLAGLIAFEVLYGFCNLLVHSDIRIDARVERWLGFFVVTPSLHRLHHSSEPKCLNRNFGTIFSCWDRLGQTYRHAENDTPVELGLPGQHARINLRSSLGLPLERSPTDSPRQKAHPKKSS